MKKLLIICLVLASAVATAQTQKEQAHANRVQGIYVFMQSQPAAEYTVLGTVKKTGITMSGSPTEMFNIILRRAKKDYPDCEAVIFEGVDMKHATCIKFKPAAQ